jgi:hypothetical protein
VRDKISGTSSYSEGVRWVVAIIAFVAGCGRIEFDASPVDAGPQVAGFRHHKAITIDGAKVTGGPHVAFPLLVELASDPQLAASARADGADLRFTTPDGITALPYEREHFDPATGALTAWVAVPSVTAGTATELELYYGDPGAPDQQQPAAVWATSYAGVWHLGGALADSTANHNDASAMNGLVVGAPAQIGTGLGYDGVDDFLVMPESASLDATAAAATFSLWINWQNPVLGHYQMVMSSSNRFVTPRNGFEWACDPTGQHYFYPWGGIEQDFNEGANPFTNQLWQYLVVTLDYATHDVVIYIDGVVLATTQDAKTLWTQLAQPQAWMWGGNPAMSGTSYFAGAMDEIRVATVVRSPGWIATELANQRSPSTFYAIGPEQ